MTSPAATPQQIILKATCPTGSGIIARVTSFLFECGCYVSELAQYDDGDSGRFFMRARFHVESGEMTLEQIQEQFPPVAAGFQMQWSMHLADAPMRSLIMVSKFDHCLADIMYRRQKGQLNMDISAIVSNHKDLRPMAEREGIRFVYLPVNKDNKLQQEQVLLDIIEETDTELV
ncbi:unnamed protein product, partial [Cyprideis torosa]